jgi:hypothetical protein
MTTHNIDAAKAAWGATIPDWVVVLAQECDRHGQAPTARRVGVAKTTINEVVRRTYKARTANVEQKVRGALMGKTVNCPVLGEITLDHCIKNRKRPFSAANPINVALHRTCPTCPHNARVPTTDSKPEE